MLPAPRLERLAARGNRAGTSTVKPAGLIRARLLIRAAASAAFLIGGGRGLAADAPVLFNRDIRPLLSDNCFPCHGFDAGKRKANLRLDIPEGATALHDGRAAIQPGNLAGSELWTRVTATDPKKAMPPPESGKKLKPRDLEALRHWIEAGAAYQKHWAFEPPVRPEAPRTGATNWVRNDLDRFVAAGLEARGWSPAPEAPRETLIRRLSLDVTGLPPTPAEVDVFLADSQPGAYERAVDRLLASPRYGEHMAKYWLDLVRYADTHGMHIDNERSVWPYRDWVVSAFNRNLPFDQFTVWQLAGDLLPDATREQRVASGFNRCNMTTSEGGAIDEEFRVRYAVDRVETTSAAWLGLTMGCAVCHDHKLDPITQKEFYQLSALFNNLNEQAMDGNALLPPPSLKVPTPEQEQKLAEFDRRLGDLGARTRDLVATLPYSDPATLTNAPKPEPKETVWIEDNFPDHAEPQYAGADITNRWVTRQEGPVFSGERALLRAGKGLHQVFFNGGAQPLTVGSGDKLFAYVYLDPKDPPKAVMLQYHTGEWRHRANWGDAEAIPFGARATTEKLLMGALPETGKWVRLEVDAAAMGLQPGMKIAGMAFTQFDGAVYWDKAGLLSPNDPAQDPGLSLAAWERVQRNLGGSSTAPAEIKTLLKVEPDQRDNTQRQKLREHFLATVYTGASSSLAPLRAEVGSLREQRAALEREIPSSLVSQELPQPRKTWLLIRGQYDKHGEEVGPGVPSVLPPLPQSEVTNRLTLARWLVDPHHPLTARVTVNRFWQQFFGVGLVKTAEDFGTRGEWPSNPALLDWLATEFIRTGWDVKQMVRLFVTSAAYRQSSQVTPQLHELDPDDRLLARGPRYRLDAEVLRDEALSVSGLLNLEQGGRGVRPYQPPGIWEAVAYTTSNTGQYTQDHGAPLYRRSLYLFWKRTAPPPSMITFDAPSREQCRARRERTNTPLQALVTMNDPQYFEAARQLGYRMLHEGGADDPSRLRYGFRLATARLPNPKECAILGESLAAQRARYAGDAEAAKKAVAVGESPMPADTAPADLAAYTMVANLLLNLDEVLTKN